MSILIEPGTRVIVQGITGREGTFHTEQMREMGTKVVGGTLVKVSSWYDNEWGFSNRMLDATVAFVNAT